MKTITKTIIIAIVMITITTTIAEGRRIESGRVSVPLPHSHFIQQLLVDRRSKEIRNTNTICLSWNWIADTHNPYNDVVCNDIILATGVFSSRELWKLSKGSIVTFIFASNLFFFHRFAHNYHLTKTLLLFLTVSLSLSRMVILIDFTLWLFLSLCFLLL